MIAVDPEYADAFKALLAAEGISDPSVFDRVRDFEEIPIFSRYQQLGFISSLGIAEQNRLLIIAAVSHVEMIAEYARTHPRGAGANLLRMVSITGWYVDGPGGGQCTDGTSELVCPNIWIGNLDSAQMASFVSHTADRPRALNLPRSACANFVADTLARSGYYRISESTSEVAHIHCPRRVYVELVRAA